MKSYEELARWYTPLEPDIAVASDELPLLDVPARPSYLAPVAPYTPAVDTSSGADSYADATPRSIAGPVGGSGVSDSATEGYVGGWDEWMKADDQPVEPERPHAAAVRLLPRARRAGPTLDVRRFVLAALVIGVVIAAVGAIVLVLFTGGSNSPRNGSPAHAAATEPAVAGGAPGCVEQHDGQVVTGAGPGGTNSGPDAIAWFQHSYYVERSATRARQVVAPDSTVSQADQIQKGIDSVPLGTTHCLQITSLGGGKYGVVLTEYRPGRSAVQYKQTVTTTVAGGRTMITGIASG